MIRAGADPLVQRVVVAIDGVADHDVIRAGTVLASWFDASIQFVADDPSQRPYLELQLDGVGIEAEPMVLLDAPQFPIEVGLHVADLDRPLVVAGAGTVGRRLAESTAAPTFLVPVLQGARRLAAGPLVLAVDGPRPPWRRMAMAAAWAVALDVPIRLVADADRRFDHPVEIAARHLRAMDLAVDVDRLHADGERPELLVARTHGATALVVSSDDLRHRALVDVAGRTGVAVLVVPGSTGSSDPEDAARVEAARVEARSGERGAEVGVTSTAVALERLAGGEIGRLGYQRPDGAPVVVPVHYAMLTGPLAASTLGAGDVVIRSLDGPKVDAARRGAVACLEIDHLDLDARSGWSVVVHGRLEVVRDADRLEAAWAAHPDPWVEGRHGHWLRLVPDEIGGRDLVP